VHRESAVNDLARRSRALPWIVVTLWLISTVFAFWFFRRTPFFIGAWCGA
jgi:hypothetical protein